MGISIDNKPSSRIFRIFKRSSSNSSTISNSSPKSNKSVSFAKEDPLVCTYPAPEEHERALIYPDQTERQMLQEQRKQLWKGGCLSGSAKFKSSVEKIYKGARKNYEGTDLSSGEFSLASARDDEEINIIVSSDMRGLEPLFCSVFKERSQWAVKRVVQSQHDKSLRKQLPEIAAAVSMRSKNFARLVALGDAEQAQ